VYVPNGGKSYPAKLEFMTRMAAWAKRLHEEGRELVLCGDINIALTEMDVHPRERKPVIGQLPEERELFQRLSASTSWMCSASSIRTIRASSPGGRPGQHAQKNIGWRLDYVLASPSIAARASSCVVLADVGTSDHAPVMMSTE